ncbi:hypothetical protein AVEN_252471-1 [Araneus ventricosus]|uniref:Uncharacterized protein n=1 Tax=Araneus ventricosus TaxID=182803 RepID=A0A4Y2ATJ7_ARAVE|nr:hypothetical protein AVEN_252471-1 [Araneus ventricosus]
MDQWLKTGTLKRSASRTEIRTTDFAAMEITVNQQDLNHEVQRPTDWLVQNKIIVPVLNKCSATASSNYFQTCTDTFDEILHHLSE